MKKRAFYTHSVFLALVACLLWSSAFVGIKIGLQYSPPIQFAGIRFIISGLLILPFVKNIRGNWQKTLRNWKIVLRISLFQTIILYTLFYLGMDRVPASIGAMIVGAGPLFVALMAHFMTGKDPLTPRKIIALIIGFSGIVLIALSKEQGEARHLRVVIGIILLLVGNSAGSLGNILVSRNRSGIAPVFLTAVQILFGGLIILLISFFFEEVSFAAKPLNYYLSLAWLSFLSAAAFTLWFVVLSRPEVKVSDINVWKFIIPVIGAVLSWVIMKGEEPQWQTLLGMLLIASSILVIYFRGIYAYFSRF